MLSLAQAAQRIDRHRSNLLRAVKAGRISGNWRIDESGLVPVYGDLRSRALQPAQGDALLELSLEHAVERIGDLTRQLERIGDLTRQLERALRDVDDWKELAKRVALPAPSSAHQVTQPLAKRLALGAPPVVAGGRPRGEPNAPLRLWRWLRSTG
jgi:hypothetical protein